MEFPDTIAEIEGRSAFGDDPSSYNESRPDYPSWMFDVLCEQGALYKGAGTLEIGPGNGLATRRLVDRGASPVVLVEPDSRFAPYLADVRDHRGNPCETMFEPFEAAHLTESSFDLVVIATAFHWLDPVRRVSKLASVTRRGGHVALLWNVFQDLNLPDPFHIATRPILSRLRNSPSGKPGLIPFALDRKERESEFLASGCFEMTMYAESHWKYQLSPRGVRSLYAGFSSISRLPEVERSELLNRLEEIAAIDFGGVVERNMTSPIYVFRKCK